MSYADHDKIVQAYKSAQDTVVADAQRIGALESLVNELRACKDRSEVAQVMRQHTTEDEEFERRASAAKGALRELPSEAVEALYYHMKDDEWFVRSGFGTEDLWEGIRAPEERSFLRTDENQIIAESANPKMRRSIEELESLADFMGKASSEFTEAFEEEDDCQLDIANRDFWEKYLGL